MKVLLLLATAWAAPWFIQIPIQLDPLALSVQETPITDFPDDFEDWTLEQSRFSFHRILENIGGSSSLPSVPEGVVLASPSKANPDYYYNWIRDSALTIRSLIYEMRDKKGNSFPSEITSKSSVSSDSSADSSAPSFGGFGESSETNLKSVVESYIKANHRLQRLPNRSGHFEDRSGLGEPKFMADMSAFDGSWGRPQSDGPALRVSTIANFMNLLEETGQDYGSGLNASFVYNEILRPDLEYVLDRWHIPSFDLWEEVEGMHFFTVLVQLRAVTDGAIIASKNGDVDFEKLLKSAAFEIQEYIASAGFVGPLHIIETPSIWGREGLDAASLLATLHAHNMDFGGTDSIPFDVDDSHILNTIAALVLVMKRLYPINAGQGMALGRYPEDVYNGDGVSEGNPWFICTASAAEVLYKMVYKKREDKTDINTSELTLFVKILGLDLSENISHGTPEWDQFLNSTVFMADSFLRKMRIHMNTEGHMSEQFNKYTGFMQGASDLTWSYSSFYNCVRWREAVKAQVKA